MLLTQEKIDAEHSPSIAIKLANAEKRLETMLGKQDVLSFYLNEIINIFSKPEAFIEINVACFRLNDMGVMIEDDIPSTNTVCFSELVISNVLKRVVTIVSFDKAELNNHQ